MSLVISYYIDISVGLAAPVAGLRSFLLWGTSFLFMSAKRRVILVSTANLIVDISVTLKKKERYFNLTHDYAFVMIRPWRM